MNLWWKSSKESQIWTLSLRTTKTTMALQKPSRSASRVTNSSVVCLIKTNEVHRRDNFRDSWKTRIQVRNLRTLKRVYSCKFTNRRLGIHKNPKDRKISISLLKLTSKLPKKAILNAILHLWKIRTSLESLNQKVIRISLH